MSTTVTGRSFKNSIFEQFARIGKAVSAPRRLELLELLMQGPRTVESLAHGLGQSIANTSQHLQILRGARLVNAEKDGLYVYYRLADEAVGEFYRALRRLAESHLAEVKAVTQDFLSLHHLLDEIPAEELERLVKSGEATVIDLRSPEEYTIGHIPGALSIPFRELKSRLKDLPKNRGVVAYCRGPYCVLGIEAVEFLTENGITAYRLSDGVPEWKANGNEVAVSNDNGE